MDSTLTQLKSHLREIDDLSSAVAVLRWDQSTHMPAGGAEARGRQIATVARLAHSRRMDPALGELLERAAEVVADLPEGHVDRDLVRVARKDYERSALVPAAFIERLYENGALSYSAWSRARPCDDFSLVEPYLSRTVELSREMAGFFPGGAHIADPLIDQSDEGMTAATVRALFSELRAELTPMVEAICAHPGEDPAWLHRRFDPDTQLKFGLAAAQRLGYDLGRGRLDLTLHPYMTKFSLGDVRITTNIKEHDVVDGLFSTLHEAGHALYEQGIDPSLEGGPLADGVSAGVHESQSRLWENRVGRSLGFWTYYYPRLQATFPAELEGVGLDSFYRGINRVSRSLIRTEADEVTYNLHVIIRFDLEMALLEGDLSVADLPGAWRERYRKDLGVDPGSDKDGVLQDVHWYDGLVGGLFQGYTIGNILSAQFYDAAVAAEPSIPEEISRGHFTPLREWLRENVYQYGRRLPAPALVERATGRPTTIGPYVAYLREKYGELYAL